MQVHSKHTLIAEKQKKKKKKKKNLNCLFLQNNFSFHLVAFHK